MRANFLFIFCGSDCDLRRRQVVIKNIRICIDGVNENYYIVVVSV
ncbi:hypothetical protein KUC_1359 [Vreelandella boliviensis LC1]|uniref:Uncharacterized protein n=1 Tax=Vreelandella boliviensis LC1 TaxID=1072583 RepID=A0A7U9C4U4_9GAMM|nr:hypothetical protein KUC_1359 [Halomonas boliviensis LC1]